MGFESIILRDHRASFKRDRKRGKQQNSWTCTDYKYWDLDHVAVWFDISHNAIGFIVHYTWQIKHSRQYFPPYLSTMGNNLGVHLHFLQPVRKGTSMDVCVCYEPQGVLQRYLCPTRIPHTHIWVRHGKRHGIIHTRSFSLFFCCQFPPKPPPPKKKNPTKWLMTTIS